jgi:hypothetical protein
MAIKKKAPKRKAKGKVVEPVVEGLVESTKESEIPTLDVKAEREALFNSWKRLVKIANTLLTQAELDPLSCKASMIQQIVRVLTSSGKILDDYEKFQRKVEEEPEIDPETGEETITPEEQEMIDWANNQGKVEGKDTEYKDPDVGFGLNFRRD